VASFYDDHGVSTRIRADDFETVTRFYDLMNTHEVELVSEEPLRVEAAASRDGDEIRLTFDETVSVVDVSR
jgi:hypothetical protein